MKWLTPLALLTAVAAATAKPKLVRPSQRVDLIYPADTVNLHQVFSVGVADNSPAAISGLQENVTISLTWPNGTRADLITAVNNCTPSAGLSGAYTANVNATDVGRCAGSPPLSLRLRLMHSTQLHRNMELHIRDVRRPQPGERLVLRPRPVLRRVPAPEHHLRCEGLGEGPRRAAHYRRDEAPVPADRTRQVVRISSCVHTPAVLDCVVDCSALLCLRDTR
jgi:hypothetical protein